MVKPIWIAAAFFAGIVIGAAAMRMTADPPTTAPAVASATQAPSEFHGVSTPEAVASSIAPVSQPVPVSAASQPVAPSLPAARAMPPAPVVAGGGGRSSTPDGQNPFPPLPADDGSAVAQPIDVGEPFRKDMARLSAEGDTIADAHRALEREIRDDAWSYQSEADIQSMLIPETGAGNFESHYVECRATLCEVRLSAQNEMQAESLRVWADTLNKQPWSSRLHPMYSTSITKDGKTDRLIILRKPRK